MIGDIYIVADIVKQCSNLQNQARFVVQLVERFCLIENLQSQFSDDGRMLFIKVILTSEPHGRFDDLPAVGPFFTIAEFGDGFEKYAVLQPDSGNNDFGDTCFLYDFLQYDRRGYDDIRTVRPQTEVLNPLLDRHSAQFLDERFQFVRGYFLTAVLVEQLLA